MEQERFPREMLTGLDLPPLGIVIVMMLILIVLGMFFDPTGIVLLTAPIFFPIVISLGFDPLWFAILFVINMELAYLTPPFGFSLFYLRGVCPDNVPTSAIYRGVIPFIFIQALVLLLLAGGLLQMWRLSLPLGLFLAK